MSNHSIHSPRFPIVRRFWKPAAVTGAGGTALAIWFEEIAIFAQDILALIFLPGACATTIVGAATMSDAKVAELID